MCMNRPHALQPEGELGLSALQRTSCGLLPNAAVRVEPYRPTLENVCLELTVTVDIFKEDKRATIRETVAVAAIRSAMAGQLLYLAQDFPVNCGGLAVTVGVRRIAVANLADDGKAAADEKEEGECSDDDVTTAPADWALVTSATLIVALPNAANTNLTWEPSTAPRPVLNKIKFSVLSVAAAAASSISTSTSIISLLPPTPSPTIGVGHRRPRRRARHDFPTRVCDAPVSARGDQGTQHSARQGHDAVGTAGHRQDPDRHQDRGGDRRRPRTDHYQRARGADALGRCRRRADSRNLSAGTRRKFSAACPPTVQHPHTGELTCRCSGGGGGGGDVGGACVCVWWWWWWWTKQEQNAKGDQSGLHVIIFDEMDALFEARGSNPNAPNSGVVQQMLSLLQGVDELKNILVIGMTNRPEVIDPALLRSGRMEVKVYIGLPDEPGRREIFAIHTRDMAKAGMLAPDVDLTQLAALSKQFSGAEICGECFFFCCSACSASAASRVSSHAFAIRCMFERGDARAARQGQGQRWRRVRAPGRPEAAARHDGPLSRGDQGDDAGDGRRRRRHQESPARRPPRVGSRLLERVGVAQRADRAGQGRSEHAAPLVSHPGRTRIRQDGAGREVGARERVWLRQVYLVSVARARAVASLLASLIAVSRISFISFCHQNPWSQPPARPPACTHTHTCALTRPDDFVGMDASGKMGGIKKVFDAAYASSLSLIVVDNIERLIGPSPSPLPPDRGLSRVTFWLLPRAQNTDRSGDAIPTKFSRRSSCC